MGTVRHGGSILWLLPHGQRPRSLPGLEEAFRRSFRGGVSAYSEEGALSRALSSEAMTALGDLSGPEEEWGGLCPGRDGVAFFRVAS